MEKEFLDYLLCTDPKSDGSEYFCILPWIHMHVMPNGDALACCVSPYDKSMGNLSQGTFKDIWNNENFKQMRLNMLQQKPTSTCHQCYQLESAGVKSFRNHMNERFEKQADIVQQTKDDGSLDEMNLKYLDIRFSNICNFKCRGCSHELSSAWHADHHKLYEYDSHRPAIIKISDSSPTYWQELELYIPQIVEAYFAGGEPLLMDEHYKVLDLLIKNKRDDVVLRYNTNLSRLQFKNFDLLEIWKQFKNVELGVSIDDIEGRGEYFRSGMRWKTMVENLERVKNECPHVKIELNCTVSLFNVYFLPEIHKFFYERGILDEWGFHLNILLGPDEYRVQLFPELAKKEIQEKLSQYMDDLVVKYNDVDFTGLREKFENLYSFMFQKDLTHLKNDFYKRNDRLDQMRNESFYKTMPKIHQLLEMQ